jgi:hypothetical protein
MRIFFYTVILFFLTDCTSSREKCFQDESFISICESFKIIFGTPLTDKARETIALTCLLGDEERKNCMNKPNYDIQDIF